MVQLDKASQPAKNQLEGWVEEVDSGKQLRFRSADELITFLTGWIQALHRREDVQGDDPETSSPAES